MNPNTSSALSLTQELTLCRTMFYGLALGDALGWPTEFKTLDGIKATWGPKGIQELPRPALFTDDTQMTIRLARALVSAGKKDINEIMGHLAAEFIDWYSHSENTRAPGTSCMGGIAALKRGAHWSCSGASDSLGCGAAMRVAPIGYLFRDDIKFLTEFTLASSAITHGHPAAQWSAVAAAYLVTLALNKVEPAEMLTRVTELVKGKSTELDLAFQRLNLVLSEKNEELAMNIIGQGWTGHEAVPLALYCVLKYPDSYVETVKRGANFGGDSDSVACIAGSIQALRLGESAIPSDWASVLERREEIDLLAQNLASLRLKL